MFSQLIMTVFILSSDSNPAAELPASEPASKDVAPGKAGGWQKPKTQSHSSSDSEREGAAGGGGWKPGILWSKSFD